MNNELQDTDKMPFGKHKGVLMQDVPVHYLHWFYCNVTTVKGQDSERVLDYINKSIHALKQENEDLIWQRPN